MKVGDTRILKQVCKRRECEKCDAPATHKLSFLLPHARTNQASSAYGKDDCSWCSDEKMFVCDEHEKDRHHIAEELGMGWCSSFPYAKFEHMFLYWEVVK